MGSHSRRNLRSQVAHVGTLGVAAGSIVLAGTASAQGIEVDGQAYVAIKVATWQLTADGQALVTLSDGSTHSLAAGDFQIIDGQFYALESLVGPDGSGLLGAGLIAAGGAGALVIGALALTAGGNGNTGPAGSTQAQGTAVKGPLSDAFVYYDANGNGQFDTGEVSIRTGADGAYDLDLSQVSSHDSNASVIVTTDGRTIDTGSGAVLSGITLKATAGSSVATPLTTLMVETGLSSDALKQVLGLTGTADLANYNPYADDSGTDDALSTEKVSAQVASTLAGMTSVAVGSGASQAEAYDAALDALSSLISTHQAAGTVLDLTQSGDDSQLDQVRETFETNLADANDLDSALFDTVVRDVMAAISTVNSAISDLDDSDLTADGNKGASGLIQVLQDDIEQALATGGDIALADITDDGLEALIANLAPTDIALAGTNDDSEMSIAEDTGDLTLGALSAVDTDADGADSSGSVRFEIALVDGVAVSPDSSPFEIDDQNNLLFTDQPDFETKSSYSLTIHATDTGGKTFAETFVINVEDANDAAVISGDTSGSVTEDATLSASGRLSVTDENEGEGTFTVQTDADTDYGTFSINAAGAWTYTLNNDHAAVQALGDSDSIDDRITVTSADGTEQHIVVSIIGTNDAPLIKSFEPTIEEDTNLLIQVSDLASDAEEDTLNIIAVDNGTNGTAVLNENGTITFTPDVNHNGPASFRYTVSDGTDTSTGTVNVTVDPVNDAPVVEALNLEIDEDTDLVVGVADLLANARDADDDELSITAVGNEVGGTVVLNENGTITFTPAENYNGPASFRYTVSDGTTTIDGTVNVTVGPVNDAPVAVADSASTEEDRPLTIEVSDLLENDSDVEEDTLSISAVGNASNGQIEFNQIAKTITYTPNANYNGADSFEYTLSDGQGGTATGTVNVTVTAVNDAPVGKPDIVDTNEDTRLAIEVADLLANDDDIDEDTLRVVTVDNAVNGTVDLNGDVITFTPKLNFFTDTDAGNTASFTYNISDNAGGSAVDILVTVNVVPQPDEPGLRGPRTGDVTEDGSESDSGTVNVADPDKDESGFQVSTQTSNYGTFAISANGEWTYQINNAGRDVQALGGSETHEDTFTAQTIDGTEVEFTITINGTNDVPVLLGESEKSINVDERGVYTGYTPNATDQDENDEVTFAIAGPDGDLFEFAPETGELLFRSAPNFERPLGSEGGQNEELGNTYVVEIIATDDQGAQDSETIRINVTDVEESNPLAEFIQGLDANALLGSSVSILGDINGDGVDDLIVTRPGVAESYIVFGIDGGSILAKTDGSHIYDIVLTGGAVTSVATGDIDGDGLNDIVLGVSGARSAAGNAAGKTFVIYGKNTFDDQQTLVDPFNTSINLALEVEASTADGNPLGFVLEGANEGDLSGFAVAVTNNDLGTGPGQLLIGAPGFLSPYDSEDGSGAYEAQTGQVYVIQGQSGDARLYGSHSLADVGEENGLAGFYDTSEVDIGFRLSGFSLSSSGDINGDSIADFVGTGFDAIDGSLVAVALFGQDPWPNGPVDLSDPNQNPSVIVTGFGTNINSIDVEDASQLVSIIGDINGDGVDDVLVGDPHWSALDEGADAAIEDIGRSYVIFGPNLEAGQTQQSVVLDVVDDIVRGDGSLGFVINNAYQGEQHGYAVAAAGDVNGDDIDDLIVTNPGAVWTVPDGEGFNLVEAGAAIVIFGQQDGFDSMLDPWSVNGTDGFIIAGPTVSDAGFGTTVMSQPGDINNDGFDDIVLGLPEWSLDTADGTGAIYTIYGQSIFDSHVFF